MQLYVVLNNEREDRDAAGIFFYHPTKKFVVEKR